MSARCECGHVQLEHRSGPVDSCQIKRCPCGGFLRALVWTPVPDVEARIAALERDLAEARRVIELIRGHLGIAEVTS